MHIQTIIAPCNSIPFGVSLQTPFNLCGASLAQSGYAPPGDTIK
jgi:hypothetical protein